MVDESEQVKQLEYLQEEVKQPENHQNISIPLMVPLNKSPRQAIVSKPVSFIQYAERDLVYMTKKRHFMTIQELENFLLPGLNAGYSDITGKKTNIFEVRKNAKYVKLICKTCKKFDIWYNYSEIGGAITFERIIN